MMFLLKISLILRIKIILEKIEKLLLNNGRYNNIQVILETWINEMCVLQ